MLKFSKFICFILQYIFRISLDKSNMSKRNNLDIKSDFIQIWGNFVMYRTYSKLLLANKRRCPLSEGGVEARRIERRTKKRAHVQSVRDSRPCIGRVLVGERHATATRHDTTRHSQYSYSCRRLSDGRGRSSSHIIIIIISPRSSRT